MWELEDTDTHLQLFQLLQDHVVRHVVEQSVCGGQDDVPKLDIEGRAVSSLGAGDGQRLKDSSPHKDTKQPHTAHPQLLHSPALRGFVQEREIITPCGALAPGWAVRKAPPQPLWLQTGFAVKIPTWAILQTNLLQECVSMETSKQNGSSGLPSAHLEDMREWYLKEQFITGLAQTLQDSESLSNSMEYETCLEITTRRPESVQCLCLTHYITPRGEKLPVWARISLQNLILRSNITTNLSFLKTLQGSVKRRNRWNPDHWALPKHRGAALLNWCVATGRLMELRLPACAHI